MIGPKKEAQGWHLGTSPSTDCIESSNQHYTPQFIENQDLENEAEALKILELAYDCFRSGALYLEIYKEWERLNDPVGRVRQAFGHFQDPEGAYYE